MVMKYLLYHQMIIINLLIEIIKNITILNNDT